MKLLLGSDKSGFLLKEFLKEYIQSTTHEMEDIGTLDMENGKPFFKVAPIAAKSISAGEADRAILICGTGMGMSQVANKYPGVRAAAVENLYSAKMCRAINDSNVLCMGGWMVGPELGLSMLKAFLETEFAQDLEEWRKEFLTNAKREFSDIEKEIYG